MDSIKKRLGQGKKSRSGGAAQGQDPRSDGAGMGPEVLPDPKGTYKNGPEPLKRAQKAILECMPFGVKVMS